MFGVFISKVDLGWGLDFEYVYYCKIFWRCFVVLFYSCFVYGVFGWFGIWDGLVIKVVWDYCFVYFGMVESW